MLSSLSSLLFLYLRKRAFIVLLLELQNFMSVPVEEVIPNLFFITCAVTSHFQTRGLPLQRER
jgi:hypothetical protein